MKITKILTFAAFVLCLVSCGTVQKSSPYNVSSTRMELNMDDFVFLGESEISCEYDTYLGFIRRLNTVNGEMFNPGEKISLNISTNNTALFKNKGMKYAAAKLRKKYPNAHYFQVVMDQKTTDVLFLGSTTKRVAKVRVYKFADHKPAPSCCAGELAKQLAIQLNK